MDGTLLSSLNYAFSASSFGLALLSYFKTVSELNSDNLNSLILTAASSALQIGVQILSHNLEPQPISPEEEQTLPSHNPEVNPGEPFLLSHIDWGFWLREQVGIINFLNYYPILR